MKFNLKIITMAFALAMMTTTAFAKPPKPPAEAFAACVSSTEGAACQVTTRHGELSGSCRIPPEENQLVCVPSGYERGGDRKPENKTQSE